MNFKTAALFSVGVVGLASWWVGPWLPLAAALLAALAAPVLLWKAKRIVTGWGLFLLTVAYAALGPAVEAVRVPLYQHWGNNIMAEIDRAGDKAAAVETARHMAPFGMNVGYDPPDFWQVSFRDRWDLLDWWQFSSEKRQWLQD